MKVRGPLNPSDVVTSSLEVTVVDDDCVHLCHSDGRASTNISFVLVTLPPYNISHVVVDFGDGTVSNVVATPTRRSHDLPAPPSWAAECYRYRGQVTSAREYVF